MCSGTVHMLCCEHEARARTPYQLLRKLVCPLHTQNVNPVDALWREGKYKTVSYNSFPIRLP